MHFEEADDGKVRNILIPVLMERINPPIGFRSIQAADLSDWHGNPTVESFQRLENDIIGLLGLPSKVKEEREERRLKEEPEEYTITTHTNTQPTFAKPYPSHSTSYF